MHFDHDAILLDEDGAATPEQGVGMLVNGKEIKVVNSSVEEAMRDLDWAVDSAVRAMEKLDNAPLFERIKSAIMDAFTSIPERETLANKKDSNMDDKKMNELSARVNELAENQDKMGKTIGDAINNALKPLMDNLAQMQANQKSKDDADKSTLINKLVKAGGWTEDECKELTLNALQKLVDKSAPLKATQINGSSSGGTGDDEWAGYEMNANIDNEIKKEAA